MHSFRRELRELILESVNVRKNCTKEELQEEGAVSSAGVTRPTKERTGQKQCLLSTLGTCGQVEDVVFNDFIKDDFIPESDGQIATCSASLPDPVGLETEEQVLIREQNERDVLEALGVRVQL